MAAIASRSETLAAELRNRRFKRPGESIILAVLTACGLLSFLITALIIFTLFEETLHFFAEVPLQDFFLRVEWQTLIGDRSNLKFGIWELVAGTANIVFWSMLVALPLGLAAAIYLSEYASPRTRKVLKPVLEALAGVPTVVYAFFALTFVTEEVLRPLLGDNHVPVFNALGASLVMAVMLLPTIASVSEDAMSNVPRDLREAAYGLGATRFEVATRVVVPAALSGIIAAILLAVARVVGETMIVAVAAGSTPNLTLAPLESIQTMTGYMLQVALGDSPRGSIEYTSLFAVGTTLFAFTFLLNVAATLIVRKFREGYE